MVARANRHTRGFFTGVLYPEHRILVRDVRIGTGANIYSCIYSSFSSWPHLGASGTIIHALPVSQSAFDLHLYHISHTTHHIPLGSSASRRPHCPPYDDQLLYNPAIPKFMPPRLSSVPRNGAFYPASDAATYRDLLLFEERLKTNAASLNRRKHRYQRASTRLLQDALILELTGWPNSIPCPATSHHRIPPFRSSSANKLLVYTIHMDPAPVTARYLWS